MVIAYIYIKMDVQFFYREMEKREEEEEKKDEKEEKKKEKIKKLKQLKKKKKEKKEKEKQKLKIFNLKKKKERAFIKFLSDINLRRDIEDNEEFFKMQRNRILRFPSFDEKEEERKKKEKNEEKKKIYHWKKKYDIKSFSYFLEKKRNERLENEEDEEKKEKIKRKFEKRYEKFINNNIEAIKKVHRGNFKKKLKDYGSPEETAAFFFKKTFKLREEDEDNEEIPEEEPKEMPEEDPKEVPEEEPKVLEEEEEYDEGEYIALKMVSICFKKAWHIIKKKEMNAEERIEYKRKKKFLKKLKISSFSFYYIQ